MISGDSNVFQREESALINGVRGKKVFNVGSSGNVVNVNSDGEMYIVSGGHVDTNNSSTTPLSGNATFTGTATDVLDVAVVIVNVKSSHASATDGLKIQFSPDGTNWDNQDTYTILAATGKTFSAQPSGKYMRVTYTNGSTLQTYFRLETLLKHTYTKPSSHRVQDTIVDDDDGELNLSVLKLKTAANNYVSGTATNSGNFKVSLEEYNGNVKTHGLPIAFMPSNMSAFGTLETSELDPSVQLDFVYGINSQTGVSTVANGASIDTNASRLRLQTSTATNGSAIFRSRRVVKYRAGQGITARFTPAFTTGVANSTQIIGIGNDVDGFFFGYNGTSFGILHRNNSSNTWTAQADWNGDTLDFTWNKTLGSPVMIKYPYLGYGNITFYIQNPTTSEWVHVHTIRYANTTATTELSNPNMFFYSQVINSGNNTNITMYCGSVGIFLSGKRSVINSPKWSMDNTKSGITTETNIITFRNATTYNGANNRSLMRLNSISFSSSAASGVAVIRLKVNSTLGGVPAFTPISGNTADNGVTITSGNSCISYDTAGTTVTGGTYIYSIYADNPGTETKDLQPYEIFLAPGETMTLSVTSTISSAVGVSLNWVEDL